MPKSVEQRTKEVSSKQSFLVASWNSATASFKKDLSAPIFKRNGDVAGLASRFDTTQEKFVEFMQKKDDAKKPFFDLNQQLQKINDQIDALQKELDGIAKEAQNHAKLGEVDSSTPIDDVLNQVEEVQKAQQELNGERKAIFDNWNKAQDGRTKLFSDAIAKGRKLLADANSGLASSNQELNTFEAQIRGTVAKYQKTAFDMSRNDIADAVRSFLTAFGN